MIGDGSDTTQKITQMNFGYFDQQTEILSSYTNPQDYILTGNALTYISIAMGNHSHKERAQEGYCTKKAPNYAILNHLFEGKRYKQACYCTFIESIGCSREVESALARPPAKADFKTLPVDISTGGGTATTVAASNQMLLNAFFK